MTKASILVLLGLLALPVDHASAAPVPEPHEEQPPPGAVRALPDDLFALRVSEELILRPVVLLQVQGIPYLDDGASIATGAPADDEGALLRRARLGFAGTVASVVPFALSVELSAPGEPVPRVLDAWAKVAAVPWLQLTAGAHKVPFSRVALVRAGDTALAERPLAVRAMAPLRQVGAGLSGEVEGGAFAYALFVGNGLEPATLRPGWLENGGLSGEGDGVLVAGRLVGSPIGALPETVADLDGGEVALGVGAAAFGSLADARDVVAVEADALLHAHGAHALTEVLWDRDDAGGVTERLAVYGEVGYTAAGFVTVAGRVEWLDPDRGTGGSVLGVTAGAAFLFFDNAVRIQADYTHRQELDAPEQDDDALQLQLQLQL